MPALDAMVDKRETMTAQERLVAGPHAESVVMACVQDASAFRALQQEWHGLHRECPNLTPFNTWEWLYSWWQAYSSSKQLRLLTWRLNGTLVALAPFYLTAEKSAVGTRTSVLRLLGDSPDSDYLDVLIRRDVFDTVVRQLGNWLAAHRTWDAFVLRELPEKSALPHALRDVAHLHGFRLRTEYGLCGVLELPDTFEAFLQSRQQRFRTKVRSLLRKLDEHALTLEVDSDPWKLRRRLRSLFDLHQRRWAHAGAPGVFGDATKRAFYRHFVPRFARSGWLRLFSLRDGDTYLAHQLCFGAHGTTYLLQEGFDISNGAASYGQMLRAAVMRHLIERGECQYDFLGGFSRHKEDWGAKEGKSVHLVIARRGWRGTLYFELPLWRARTAVAAKGVLPDAAVRMVKRMRAVWF